MKKTNERIIVTPNSKTLTSVYCEVGILDLCRARFGTIRAALHYAANNALIQNNTINKTTNE